MAKKFIIVQAEAPITYKVVNERPPAPEPKEPAAPGEPVKSTLVLAAEAEGDVTLSKLSLVVEPI